MSVDINRAAVKLFLSFGTPPEDKVSAQVNELLYSYKGSPGYGALEKKTFSHLLKHLRNTRSNYRLEHFVPSLTACGINTYSVSQLANAKTAQKVANHAKGQKPAFTIYVQGLITQRINILKANPGASAATIDAAWRNLNRVVRSTLQKGGDDNAPGDPSSQEDKDASEVSSVDDENGLDHATPGIPEANQDKGKDKVTDRQALEDSGPSLDTGGDELAEEQGVAIQLPKVPGRKRNAKEISSNKQTTKKKRRTTGNPSHEDTESAKATLDRPATKTNKKRKAAVQEKASKKARRRSTRTRKIRDSSLEQELPPKSNHAAKGKRKGK